MARRHFAIWLTGTCRHAALIASALLLSFQTGASLAASEGALKGDFYLQKEVCQEGSAKCEITLEIQGEAARALYENMKSKAEKDDCTEGFVKIDSGALRCFLMPDKTYECDVGYSFAKKRFVGSDVSC
jgi:hypothetical protein